MSENGTLMANMYTEQVDWSEKSILVIENDIYSILLISNFLAETNVRIISVSEKEAQLNIYCPVDLIVKGINIKEMNTGLKLTRKIRAKYLGIPIIAHSACAFSEDVHACYEAGCDDFIPKPFDLDDFFQVLNKYLK